MQEFPVVFAPTMTQQTVVVAVRDDQLLEGNEDFVGTLSLPAGSSGVTLGISSAVATIIDDDGEFNFYMVIVDKCYS